VYDALIMEIVDGDEDLSYDHCCFDVKKLAILELQEREEVATSNKFLEHPTTVR